MTDTTPARQRWLRLALPGVVVAAAFLLFGCYTILKHPVTDGEGPERTDVHPQEYYRQNCLDCHADYNEYPYGYFYGVYPDYYWQYPRFGYYYAYPWWWDRHWYEAGSEDEQGEEVVEGQKAARRGGLIPPYVTGMPAINTGGNFGGGGGYVAPGTISGGKTGTGGSTGAGGEQPEKTRVRMGSADSTQTPSTDAKETKSTKATRRGGTKP